MPIYISFLKTSLDANKDLKRSRERFEEGKKNVESFGGRVLSAYYVVSRSEYLIITEFPDEEARVKSMISTLQRGTVAYEVCRAMAVEDFFKLLDEV